VLGRVCILGLLFALPTCAAAQQTARPIFELRPGERFFRVDGSAAFVLGRNPTARTSDRFDEHFRSAAAAGERFVRIHFTYSSPDERPGEIDSGLLAAWDDILVRAEKQQLGVLPVLGVWADWNDGSRQEAWHAWDKNPFNAARGGPARSPAELFEDSACRKLWFERLKGFVTHWSPHRNIVAWEIFSEVDLVTGATESRAVAFVETAARIIRAADPLRRPVTVSQAGVQEWTALLRSHAVELVQVHPYAAGAFGGNLDDLILSSVRSRWKRYGKPVLIGECGLDSAAPRGTLEVAPRAAIGVRHAVWAAVVSGAMNGRMLWWQDGYDQFEKVDLCSHYSQIAASAVTFVQGVDFAGFVPLECEASAELKGAMLGDTRAALGWFRDARCVPPEWPVRELQRQTVKLARPAGRWKLEFFDPVTGTTCGSRELISDGNEIAIDIPAFEDAIAIQLNVDAR
jgi:hypothetical protein